MCDMKLDKRHIERHFAITFDEYFGNSLRRLEPFINDGLVTTSDHAIVVNGMGRLVIRNIAMVFDAYLEQMMKEKPIFSKTL